MKKYTLKIKKGKGLNTKEKNKKKSEEKTKEYNATIKLLSGLKKYMKNTHMQNEAV